MLKIWVKILLKNISKSLISKYSQNPLGHAKQSATDAFKTCSKRVTQKTVEAADHLIGYKIAEQIATVSKTSPKSNSYKRKIYITRTRTKNY